VSHFQKLFGTNWHGNALLFLGFCECSTTFGVIRCGSSVFLSVNYNTLEFIAILTDAMSSVDICLWLAVVILLGRQSIGMDNVFEYCGQNRYLITEIDIETEYRKRSRKKPIPIIKTKIEIGKNIFGFKPWIKNDTKISNK